MTTILPSRRALTPAPTLPDEVHVGYRHETGGQLTAHRDLDCPLVRSAFPSTPAQMRLHAANWCDLCWPNQQRCRCGAPSGDRIECADCNADTLRVDTALRIAS